VELVHGGRFISSTVTNIERSCGDIPTSDLKDMERGDDEIDESQYNIPVPAGT
jgi:hypothetical protein